MTAAISPGNRRKASPSAETLLYGTTTVWIATSGVTPGVSAMPRVARPDPADARKGSA